MSKEYTKYDKKKLIDRIGKINSKNSHKEIKKIIEKNNPELESTKNRNGVFIYFNDLTKKTYNLIEIYLDKYDKQRSKLSEKERHNILLKAVTNYGYSNVIKKLFELRALAKNTNNSNKINKYNKDIIGLEKWKKYMEYIMKGGSINSNLSKINLSKINKLIKNILEIEKNIKK